MKILLVRHAIAGEREAFAKTGQPDEKRPLTRDGKKKFKKTAQGLRKILPQVDVIVSSPLVRAVQTAEILQKAYGKKKLLKNWALSPDENFSGVLQLLQKNQNRSVVALVGHEPHLSELTSWLLTGKDKPFLAYKKGGACLLEFFGKIELGQAFLNWMMTPGHLRKIA